MVRTIVFERSPGGRSETGVRFVKQLGFKPGMKWTREGEEVMDEQSGESKEEEVMGEWTGEYEMQVLVPVWSSRKDKGSWFQKQGEA